MKTGPSCTANGIVIFPSCPCECSHFTLLLGLTIRYLHTSILPAFSLLPMRPACSCLIKPAPLDGVLIPLLPTPHPLSNAARHSSLGTGLFLFPSPLTFRPVSPHPSLNTVFKEIAFPALSPLIPHRSSHSCWSLEMLFTKPTCRHFPPQGPFPPTRHFLLLGA